MKIDESLLHRAIELALTGITNGGGPFGALVVKGEKIISEANNIVVLSHDPTAHAEIVAIRKASDVLGTHDLSDCIIYASCEPCPMCLGAIYWAGIKKVIYASNRYDAAKAGFSDKLIYDEIILNPEKRSVVFIDFPEAGGEKVFKKWNDYEGKISY